MSTNEELIARIRLYADQAEISDNAESEFSRDMDSVATTLEAVTAERDALTAVVEQVRAVAHGPWPYRRRGGGNDTAERVSALMDALNTAPPAALDHVRAKAWNEGHHAGHQNANAGPLEVEVGNPYQKDESND